MIIIKRILIFLSITILLISCKNLTNSVVVSTERELQEAILNAKAGDEIVLNNGTWKDIQIKFKGNGTESKPIILKAETAGEVFIEGESDLKLSGEFLVVDGLYFRDGYTPSNSVIEFRISKNQLANNSRVTNCVIEHFNQLRRDRPDHWVEFWGRHNKLDHCYIAGKSNQGPTVRVFIKGNESIKNHHQIISNHFGQRPRKGGPRAETIQIGDSYTSMSPSNTLVANTCLSAATAKLKLFRTRLIIMSSEIMFFINVKVHW